VLQEGKALMRQLSAVLFRSKIDNLALEFVDWHTCVSKLGTYFIHETRLKDTRRWRSCEGVHLGAEELL
jgi:hypothetical protein